MKWLKLACFWNILSKAKKEIHFFTIIFAIQMASFNKNFTHNFAISNKKKLKPPFSTFLLFSVRYIILCILYENQRLLEPYLQAPHQIQRSTNTLTLVSESNIIVLWTKWFWVRVQLQSLNLQISRLLRARSSSTFRQL